ncbi:beta-sarcoglycan-like [Mya arenaria]|uniref:beta-sarcoglycan-like n=1 Tax=Mya arenaria TaxID=6604 RepID=UPI0022E8F72C|nr:beta-sarcoglycan-like [Mya arenaria]
MADDQVTLRHRSTRPSSSQADGYILVDEDDYEQTGLRGGRSCCLWIVITLLFLVAVLNALVTAGLLYFLSITHEGMASLELFTGESAVRVLSNLTVDNLVLHSNIEGRGDRDLVFKGEEISVGTEKYSKVEMSGKSVLLTGGQFELWTESGKPLFSTSAPLNLDLYQVTNLHASALDVGAVTGTSLFPDLHIESDQITQMIGTEGVDFSSEGDIGIHGGADLNLQAKEVVLDSQVYLSLFLPVEGKGEGSQSSSTQMLLCVCAGSGRVFTLPDTHADTSCADAVVGVHPCDL